MSIQIVFQCLFKFSPSLAKAKKMAFVVFAKNSKILASVKHVKILQWIKIYACMHGLEVSFVSGCVNCGFSTWHIPPRRKRRRRSRVLFCCHSITEKSIINVPILFLTCIYDMLCCRAIGRHWAVSTCVKVGRGVSSWIIWRPQENDVE